MNEHKKDGRPKNHFIAIWLILIIAAFALCFAAGYALSELSFKAIGRPSKVFEHVISSLLGLVILLTAASVAKLFTELYELKHPDKHLWRQAFDHSVFLKSTMDAMNRIAHGDFNVLIPVEKDDPFSEVAESVNKMAQELSSMEKLRQDFISNVSHEIQSPLTSISGFAALLKSDSPTAEERIHYIDIIETESNRLSNLSANLLKLSALESDAMPIALHEYRLDKQIESTVLMLEPQWSEKNLNPNISLSKIVVCGDEELLSQVWINLLHNMTKFTPKGGNFDITLITDGNETRCTISDNGIGIPKEEQIHIFERFYKVDKSRDRSLGGSGLGLSLVKKIVELHGGTIDLQSEPGKGTTFTVRLPVDKEPDLSNSSADALSR